MHVSRIIVPRGSKGRLILHKFSKILLACAALQCALAPASANDSSSAIGIGGLELTKNDSVSMDSEELYISRKQVRVKYQFTNVSDRDVDMLVSFPLPAIPGGIDGYLGDR